MPPPRLFPYRREDVACLDRALSARPSWKFRYYRAVLAALFQDDARADELLAECGDNACDLWQEAWKNLGDEKMAATYPENLGKGAPYPPPR